MSLVHRSDGASRLSTKPGLFRFLLAALGVLAAASPGFTEDPAQLSQQGYVNDFANFIGDNESTRIGEVCRALDQQTGDRVLVVTVNSTGSLTPGQFGEQLRNSWNSVAEIRERTLVIVVNGQGRVGFGIGSALESVLTHEKLGAALQGSLAVGGDDYGQKLLYMVQRIAEDIESAGGRAGAANSLPSKPSGTAPTTPGHRNMPAPLSNRMIPYGAMLGAAAGTLALRLGRRSLLLTILWSALIGLLVYSLFLRLAHAQYFSEDEQKSLVIGFALGVGTTAVGVLFGLAKRNLARLRP